MTREEAHTLLEVMAIELTGELADIECPVTERTKLLGKQLEAIDMAIEALQEVQRHEETFEWCHGCNEYDKDNHCCHRWSKVIRNTVEELKTDRPQGEWKHTITWQPYCSNCEYVFGEDEEFSPFWKYCPMCGARMRGGVE